MVISQRQYNNLWFYTLVVLLAVQYFRPQEFIPSLLGAPLFLPVAILTLGFVILSEQLLKTIGMTQIRLILLFICWMTLLIPFSQSKRAALECMQNFIPYLPFILSVPILVSTTKTLRKLIDVQILIAVIIALIGLMTHDNERYQLYIFGNFLTDCNDYALYMNTMFPIGFFMAMYEKKSFYKKFFYYAAATFLTLTSTIVSFSRGGFLGLICVGIVIWWFSPNKKISTVLTTIMIISILLFSSTEWKETASTAFDAEQSTAQTRIDAWKLSLRIFVDHPMGIGMDSVRNTAPRYARLYENPRWDVNHSFWLTALVEGGIIGFIIVMMILWYNIKTTLWLSRLKAINEETRLLKYVGYAYFGSLVGFCSSGTFLTVNYYPHFWYMTAMIATSGKFLYRLSKERQLS